MFCNSIFEIHLCYSPSTGKLFPLIGIEKENIRQIGEGQFVVVRTVGDSSGNYFAYKSKAMGLLSNYHAFCTH